MTRLAKGYSPIVALCIAFGLATAPAARADLIDLIRIGDKDGFGYGAAPGFRAANGGLANRNGGPVLDAGDFLPDIDRDGDLSTGSRDQFDLRSTSEVNNTATFLGAGVTNRAGTTGSNFTDISLARSYDAASAAGRVLIGGNPNTGLVFGAGGPFPSPPSTTLPNQPGFVFDFDVTKASLAANTPIFFNLVFGDYDVTPASIRITKDDGTFRFLDLMVQGAGSNGLIQAATATLNFDDVFNSLDASTWRGSIRVDFVAPNEPYTAFDYVELSKVALVPEPSSVLMIGTGLAAVGMLARRRVRGRAQAA